MPDEALAFGAAVGALIGLGAAGEEGMELGAVWGLRELADGHVFDDEDKWRVADAIQPGEGALIALVEHRWAIPVREAVRRAGRPCRRGTLDRRTRPDPTRRELDADPARAREGQ